MYPSKDYLLERARRAMALEEQAIRATADKLDHRFIRIIELIRDTLANQRKLILTGVGKNVPVCLKLAGTFNSTGVPAAFLDPNQALHGDLGLCLEDDLCLLFSNSGETEDLLRLLPSLHRLGIRTVAVTSQDQSSLARTCHHVLPYHYDCEACPLNLAPTASTTAALALGDAIAMVYLEWRGFTAEDFAKYHPSGSLGKSLLLKVDEIMRRGSSFACKPDSITVQEALLAITDARCGSIALTGPDGALSGVFSDGDFRRAALHHPDILRLGVAKFMTRNPVTIATGALAVEALRVFEKANVNDLIVVDPAFRPVGLVDGQDIPKLKIV